MRDKLYTNTNKLLIDAVINAAAFWLAYQIRFEGNVPSEYRSQYWIFLLPVLAGRMVTLAVSGLTKHKWRYVGAIEALHIARAYALFSCVLFLARLSLPVSDSFRVP